MMHVEVYRRPDGKFGWRLVVNGRVIATDHGQGYERRGRALEMAQAVVGGAYVDAEIRIVD